MSEKFWYIVIAAVVILLVVWMLRRQLKSMRLKAAGMEAEVETHGADNASRAATEPVARRAGVSIRNNKQVGRGSSIDVARSDTEIEGNEQRGQNQRITVRPDQSNQEEQ